MVAFSNKFLSSSSVMMDLAFCTFFGLFHPYFSKPKEDESCPPKPCFESTQTTHARCTSVKSD
jgi:hypothetical protein